MAQNKGLLDRFGERKSNSAVASSIPADMSITDKRAQVYKFVAASIMPRNIVLTVANHVLVLTASNRNLISISLFEGDRASFQEDFAGIADKDIGNTSKRGLLDAILHFLNQPGDIDVKFERAVGEYEDSSGVVADLISSDQELPEPAPEATEGPTSVSAQDQSVGLEELLASGSGAAPKPKTASAGMASSTANDGVSISMTGVPGGMASVARSGRIKTDTTAKSNAPVPFDFITRSRKQITDSVFFSNDGEQSFEDKKKIDEFVDRSEIPRISALHKTLSPLLGDEILMVFVSDDPDADRYAFAINENEGSGISFGANKMGQVCVAWLRSCLEKQ